jgi:hypothetical protein
MYIWRTETALYRLLAEIYQGDKENAVITIIHEGVIARGNWNLI